MRLSRRAFSAGLAAALATPARALAQGEASLAPDILRADFDELFERLARAHFDLFAHRSRADHEAEHARLRRALDEPMILERATGLFQRFVAFGRVAHARIDGAGDGYRKYRGQGGAIFPLTLRAKRGRLFVMSGTGGYPAIRPGGEILRIEGRAAGPLLRSFWRDVSADTPYMLSSMLEWELPRMLWQHFGPRRWFDLEVRSGHGPAREVRMAARTQAEIADAASRSALLDASVTERSYRKIGDRVGYIRPGPFYAVEHPDSPYDNRAFVQWVDEAFAAFIAAGADRLIVDLRDNPGGDNSFSDHLVGWFANRPFRFASAFRIKVSKDTVASNRARLAVPGNDPTGTSAALDRAYAGAREGRIVDFPIPLAEPRPGARYSGHVFVLTNRHSYSNAVNVAALVQDYGFGTILGEETSDLATTYGAMEQFKLSRTGIAVGYPKARIIRPSGSLAGRGVVPDIIIETPVVETRDDPVLAAAIAIARDRRAS